MSRRLEKSEHHIAHDDLAALMHRNELKLRRSRTEIDPGARSRGQLVMPGNEIGMAVRLNRVPDGDSVSLRVFKVDIDVPLLIDNGCFVSGPDEVGRMGEAS